MYDRDDFFRRARAGDGPSWRWIRAGDLLESGNSPDSLDDAVTVAAWQFRKGLIVVSRTARTPAHSLISTAHAIFIENKQRRWEIEARLLAGTATSEIAERLKIDVGIIDVYATMFFDVAGRLHALDWLAIHLPIGPWTPVDATEAQIWMHVAASGDGARAALDLLIADHLHRPEPAVPDRHQVAEDIRVIVRFTTTPPTPTPSYRRLLKQMWCLLATRVTIRDPKEWEAVVQHLDCLELVAGAKPKRKPKQADVIASTAQQLDTRQPVKAGVATGGIAATQQQHRNDDRLAGIPIPAGAPAEFRQRLGALLNDSSGRFRWPQWASNPVLAVA